MTSFHLKIVTPDRTFFEGEVEQIVVRTKVGDVGILAGHEKYVAALDIGELKVKQDGELRRAALASGFIKVGRDGTTILAVTCEWAEEIDVTRAEQAKDRAEARLKNMQTEHDLDLAEIKLKKALNRIRVAKIK